MGSTGSRCGFQNFSQPLGVDNNPAAFSENNSVAVEFIEVFRYLLPRGSYNPGEDLMTDIERDRDSARIVCAETICQVEQLESQAPAQIQPDAFDAMKVRISSWLEGRGVPPDKLIVSSAQKYLDEGLRLYRAYGAIVECFASERVTGLRYQRIKTEELTGRE